MKDYRGYVIVKHSQVPQSFRITFPGKGGRIPLCMEGAYTSIKIAMETIDIYVDNKD